MNQKRTGNGGDIKKSEDGPGAKSAKAAPRAKQLTPGGFVPSHVRIPHLREKLDLLFRHHPSIRRQDQLVAAMGISPGALRSGTGPDTIPARHFATLVDIFGVPAAVLESKNLAELKRALAEAR
jgi:hypothetical protein